ncbi:hypothetical protein ACVIJU_002032 [Aeribacillus sp. SP014]
MSRIISENENPITLTLGQVREKIREYPSQCRSY